MNGQQVAEKYGSLMHQRRYLTADRDRWQNQINRTNEELAHIEHELYTIRNEAPQLVKLLEINYENLKEEN